MTARIRKSSSLKYNPTGACKFNSGVNCSHIDCVENCGWNPAMIEKRKERAREEAEAQRKAMEEELEREEKEKAKDKDKPNTWKIIVTGEGSILMR